MNRWGLDKVSFMRAATAQLDAAIELAERGEFIPAITLAAAAEEVTGKRLGPDASIKEFLAGLLEGCGEQGAVRELTGAKNLLKHWDPGSNPDEVGLFLEVEAMTLIVRATSNLNTLHSRDGRDLDAPSPPEEAERVRRVTRLQIGFLERHREWITSVTQSRTAEGDVSLAIGIGSTAINRKRPLT